MMKQEKKAEKAPILLTEAETDHVAGGAPSGNNGNHFGQKKGAGRPWQLPDFKGDAADATGHL